MNNKKVTLNLEIHKSIWWTSNSRGNHWKAYSRTRSVKTIAHIAGRNLATLYPAQYQLVKSWDKVHVTIIIHPLTNGRFDTANASPMGKAIIDALTLCGYWVDDDYKHVIGADYRAGNKSTRKDHYQLEVVMEEARDE